MKPAKLKEGFKYIMVSATADKTICSHYFGKNNVSFYECKNARYTGTLNQYYSKPMSRDYIDRHPGIFDEIRKWSEFDTVITFMKYGEASLYFGNTEGCNFFEGENMNIVGTPHQAEFIYKLFAYTIGLNFDEDAEIKSGISVARNGYLFRFTTYKDKTLQDIQLWIIESELEQAIGRARLLRFNCTVNLFSNYPIRQAIMAEFEYEETQEKSA